MNSTSGHEAGRPGHRLLQAAARPLRRALVGACAGALVGGVAGLILAAQVLMQNPSIHGLRDRVSVLIFFPGFYLAIGVGLGTLLALATLLAPRRLRPGAGAGLCGLTVGLVSWLFLFFDGWARCYDCHQWFRDNWPSLTISPGESLVNLLFVALRSLVIGAGIGLAAGVTLRWASSGGQRPRRFLAVGGLLGAAAVVLVGIAWLKPVPRVHPPQYAPEMLRAETSRVRLIVIDGADWRLVGPLVAAGEMPHLEALIARGATGELGVGFPCISPFMWTSLSTGFGDEIHGLCDFFGYRVPGGRALVTRYPGAGDTSKELLFRRLAITLARRGIGRTPGASSRQKRVPELWDYVSAAGRRACVVGWRYSYPATALAGVMVSERFGERERSGATVYPAELAARLPVDVAEATEACVRRIVGPRIAALSPEALGPMAPRLERIRLHVGRDLRFATIGKMLIDSLQPDFAAVGLTSVDALEHRFMLEHVLGGADDPEPLTDYYRRFTSEEQLALFGPTLTRVHAVFDSLLGELTASATEEELIVVCSDHGHDLDGSGHRFGPPAMIVMAGGGVRPGARLDGAMIYDLTPTLLHVMGFPISSEFPGRVLSEAFDPAWMQRHPVRLLIADEEGERLFEPGEDLPSLSDEDLERLRSLGYVE
ncbi:MAG: alkaline phosphatase family protein [Candidatus Eisenbacteria sp.]|nr:alkaline phosphatase family protein [Candidatus Eisenbacteria bacterium]